jgi:hypothetical protein
MKWFKLSSLILVLTIVLLSPILGMAGDKDEKQQLQIQDGVRYEFGKPLLAVILTTFNIPFRGLLCVSDVGMGYMTMGASAGRRYSQASDYIEQGCAGPWILTPRRIREEHQKAEKLKGAAYTEYDQW